MADEPTFDLYPPRQVGGNPGPEIAKALVKAYQDDTGYVQKSGRVKGGAGYNFASEADLIGAIRPALIGVGITVHVVGVDELRVADHGETRSGNTMRDVKLRMTVRFLHTSGEFIDVQAYGEGSDTGDKAVPKALTIAYKYCLRQAFMVETGDDPDEVRPEAEHPPARERRKAEPEPELEASGDPEADLRRAKLRQVKTDLDENNATVRHLAVAIEAEGDVPTGDEILAWLARSSDDFDVARVNLMTEVSKVKGQDG